MVLCFYVLRSTLKYSKWRMVFCCKPELLYDAFSGCRIVYTYSFKGGSSRKNVPSSMTKWCGSLGRCAIRGGIVSVLVTSWTINNLVPSTRFWTFYVFTPTPFCTTDLESKAVIIVWHEDIRRVVGYRSKAAVSRLIWKNTFHRIKEFRHSRNSE